MENEILSYKRDIGYDILFSDEEIIIVPVRNDWRENNMTDQDKRAVEGLARCGISLEGLCDAFPRFPAEEIRAIYGRLHESDEIHG